MSQLTDVIDGHKLIDKWNITSAGLFYLVLNHHILTLCRFLGEDGWFYWEDEWHRDALNLLT